MKFLPSRLCSNSRSACLLALLFQGPGGQGPGILHADTVTVGSAAGAPGEGVSLPFRFAKTHEIVGMQFDLTFPVSQVTAGAAAAASATTNHRAESREVSAGRRRIVVYSTTNQPLPDDLFLQVPLTLGAGSAGGGPTVGMSNVLLTDRLGRTFTPTLSYPKLDEWRRGNFTAAELENAAVSGDDRDPDGDGVPNLGEYLAGTSPKQSNPAGQPVAGSLSNGGVNYFTLTWLQDRSAGAAAAEAQVSTDLSGWTAAGVTAAPTGNGTSQTAEWRATVRREGARQFLRLNFKRTAP